MSGQERLRRDCSQPHAGGAVHARGHQHVQWWLACAAKSGRNHPSQAAEDLAGRAAASCPARLPSTCFACCAPCMGRPHTLAAHIGARPRFTRPFAAPPNPTESPTGAHAATEPTTGESRQLQRCASLDSPCTDLASALPAGLQPSHCDAGIGRGRGAGSAAGQSAPSQSASTMTCCPPLLLLQAPDWDTSRVPDITDNYAAHPGGPGRLRPGAGRVCG